MSTSPTETIPCPCGLTQEQLDRHGLVGAGGICTAFRRGSRAELCGELLADHPHQIQQKQTASQEIVNTIEANRKRKRGTGNEEDSGDDIIREISEVVKSTATKIERQTKLLKCVSKILLDDCRPRAPSGETEREHHQSEMKQLARKRYDCIDSRDASKTKCMILGLYFKTDEVTCRHIVGLRNREALPRLGLSDQSLWDPRNYLLLFHEIETRFENLEITFLLDPSRQVYTLQVLYDDILDKVISVSASKVLGRGKGNLKFRDANGRPLLLPALVFPFRRALYFMSYYAYRSAIESRRSHSCALSSNPTPIVWEQIRETVATDSQCGDELAFHTAIEDTELSY